MGRLVAFNSRDQKIRLFLGIAFFLAMMALYKIGAIIGIFLNASSLVITIIRAAMVLLGAFLYHKWFKDEFDGFFGFKRVKAGLLILTPPLLASLAHILQCPSSHVNGSNVVAIATSVLFEEISCRGICESYCLRHVTNKKDIPIVILLFGIGFGLLHFNNLYYGQALDATILQVISASMSGVLYAFAFAISGSIWPSFFAHFLNNYACEMYAGTEKDIMTSGVENFWWEFPLDLALCLVALLFFWLWLRSPRIKKTIKALWERKWNKGTYAVKTGNKESLRNMGIKTAVFLMAFTIGFICVGRVSVGNIHNVMGLRGCYIDRRISGDYVERIYYQGMLLNPHKSPVAKVQGYIDEIKECSVDIDNDEVNELVCECQLTQDRAAEEGGKVVVFKKENNTIKLGAIPMKENQAFQNDTKNMRINQYYNKENNTIVMYSPGCHSKRVQVIETDQIVYETFRVLK